jgi:hypothetical protein
MTIFQNKKVYPKVFISSSQENKLLNQDLYRTNYMKQYIEQQQNMNQTLSDSFHQVNQQLMDSKVEQQHYFNQLFSKFAVHDENHLQFQNRIEDQEQANKSIFERVQHLEKFSYDLRSKVDSDELMNQAIMDGLTSQNHFIQEIVQNFKTNDQTLESIHLQLARQEELYHNLTEKLEIQEAFHQILMERLDNQEAIAQKITRQLEYLKGVIFERFSHLTDKIETTLKFTTNLFRFKPNTASEYVKDKEEDVHEEYTKQ